MNIDEAIAQIKFAKENGAAAVCMRPLEGERHLSDPYFYPIYQTAADLDLAIAIHIANGNPENCDLYRIGSGGPLRSVSRADGDSMLQSVDERVAAAVSQTPLGVHRSLRPMGALGLPRSGDPLPHSWKRFAEESF